MIKFSFISQPRQLRSITPPPSETPKAFIGSPGSPVGGSSSVKESVEAVICAARLRPSRQPGGPDTPLISLQHGPNRRRIPACEHCCRVVGPLTEQVSVRASACVCMPACQCMWVCLWRCVCDAHLHVLQGSCSKVPDGMLSPWD